jgi:hypothetical protein
MVRIDRIESVLAVQQATYTTRGCLVLVRPLGGKLLGKLYETILH